jgi:hypothetical protein
LVVWMAEWWEALTAAQTVRCSAAKWGVMTAALTVVSTAGQTVPLKVAKKADPTAVALADL